MRKRLAVLLTGAAVVSGLLVTSPAPVAGQALSTQPFVAHGNATAVSINALQLGATLVAGVQVANSAGSVFSQGLQTLTNEFGQNVSPAGQGARNAYGRGVGLEVGLATTLPADVDANQIRLASLAEAFAPPPSPLVEVSVDIPVDPLLNARAVTGRARATYDPNFCPVGRPLSFGFGSVANLGLVGTPAAPLLSTSTAGREVSTATTITYLIPNGDGTFGVVTENLVTVAPITIAGLATIEVGGPFILRATATGKPGDARNGITYSGNPILTITPVVGAPILLTLNDLLGDTGLALPLNPVLNAAVATPPRALGSLPGSATPPVVDPAGTSSSAAVDVLRLTLLDLPGLLGGDIGLGHMEAVATAPPGGVVCRFPVSKVAIPDPVQSGEEFEFKISIPSDPALFVALYNCDLIGIRATDTVEVAEGNPRFQILSADRGGVIDAAANTVTWANLGNYALGDPPIVLTIRMRVTGGVGRIRDIVDVVATLGNCRGGTTGEGIITGRGVIEGGAITGRFVLEGPTVGGTLAATGGTPVPLWVGGGLLLGAVGMVRLRRRAATVKA